jgi:tubulin--tyrosine ligase-like protein 12
MIITNDLNCMLRLADSGPKVACKYLDDPVLYHGRKFDLRFIVLVPSTQPLRVLMHKMFWIRLGNNKFLITDDNLHVYETHFTVMNYSKHNLTQLWFTDFIREFEAQYPHLKWADIQRDINR